MGPEILFIFAKIITISKKGMARLRIMHMSDSRYCF